MDTLACPGSYRKIVFSGISHAHTSSNHFSYPSPVICSATPPSSTSAIVADIKEGSSTASTQLRHSKTFLGRDSIMNKLKQSSDVPADLERVGRKLRVQDLNILLRNFGEDRRWKELNELFYWMLRRKKVNAPSYCSFIKFIGRSLNPSMAVEIYNGIVDEEIKANVFVCNSLLNSMIRNGKFKSSLDLFQEMKRNGLSPDAITYTALLAGCSKSPNGFFIALDLINEMKHKEIKMDSVMYGALLAVCASSNRHEEAQMFFDQMKNEGFSPNEYHYSSLLNAFSVNGDYKSAEELIQEMKSSGLVPNKVIMTTLLKVYVKGGLFEKARILLSELEDLCFAEDEIPYCILMDGYSKAGRIEETKSIYDDIIGRSVKSNGYAHSIMISAFCRSGLLREAKALSKEIESKYDKYDVVILNTMLCAYCRSGEIDSVMEAMKRMDQLSIAPDRNTFRILIKYFCKEKLYLLAYRTLDDMHRKGHVPEEEICSLLIFHLGRMKSYSEAYAVYNIMRYSNRPIPNPLHEKMLHILISGKLLKDAYVVVKDNMNVIPQATVKKFVSAFVKKGNINMVNDVVKSVHSNGFKFDQGMLKMAINRYNEEPEKGYLLVQLLQWSIGQGYTLDSSTRDLLSKNSHLIDRKVLSDILSKHRMSKTQFL